MVILHSYVKLPEGNREGLQVQFQPVFMVLNILYNILDTDMLHVLHIYKHVPHIDQHLPHT